MTDPTPGVFLLGVGAQKAGTSWLHQQLQQRSDADFGFLKEYHIHDALTIPKLERFRHLNVQLTKPQSWLQPRNRTHQSYIATSSSLARKILSRLLPNDGYLPAEERDNADAIG